ncbi:universal stress protein [Maribacter sp. BPC-D8]|uniref:universal stress protein n=1 Tax=Maribacter sp. BPC-D8 TaxID=3053613 RepID=UPI002B4731D5|nr:universal stress protein [Maribacter sp. BPC-D8]WRI31466.1 universal stress protein [Maribacter sp. BPC-D8]
MDKIKTIMIPFDFTKASRNALEYAVKFVGRLDHIKIVLAYVSGNCNLQLSPENFENLEKKYAGLLQNKLEWEIQEGKLVDTLLEIKKKDKIDLIIMGTAGDDKLGDNQHTNTAKLVLACNCPVLVVPKSYSEYNLVNIALVIGKEEIDDTKRLVTLLMIARKFNAKVHVLTVENEPVLYGYSKEEEKNESAIEYYLETFYQERAFIKNDDILDGINTYGIKNEIDLVTILPRNHAESGKPSEAELTQRLILNSKIPLLILE